MSYTAAAATDAVLEIRLKFCNCISFAYFRFMFVDTNFFFFVVRTFSLPSFHSIHFRPFTLPITLLSFFLSLSFSGNISFFLVFLHSIYFSVLSLPHNILHFLGVILRLCICCALIHDAQHTQTHTNTTSF